ncbi:unnamed protein product [Effrenium voratum]|uniref:Uncharacterized protein n=1 Tax=Effrenium voratum TaxID=2562239 RepID=A0AA36MSE0_9DINO|nr:unnamed protein product [Effrenium voratum]
MPSNYSALFSVIDVADAPPTYLLYVENDVDLLSAFHRDCRKGDAWAIEPHFQIASCVYSSAEGCRQYRTTWSHQKDSPAPYLHGAGLPVKDCTLHVVGVRQTLQLEGLTRGFDLTAENALAQAVANASMLPPGAIAIAVLGGASSRRLAETTGQVTLQLSLASDDTTVGDVALSLNGLQSNQPFLSEAATAMGETSLSVALVGNMTAVDGSSEEAVVELQTTTATTTADASSTSGASTSDTAASTSVSGASTSDTAASTSVSGASTSDTAASTSMPTSSANGTTSWNDSGTSSGIFESETSNLTTCLLRPLLLMIFVRFWQ